MNAYDFEVLQWIARLCPYPMIQEHLLWVVTSLAGPLLIYQPFKSKLMPDLEARSDLLALPQNLTDWYYSVAKTCIESILVFLFQKLCAHRNWEFQRSARSINSSICKDAIFSLEALIKPYWLT